MNDDSCTLLLGATSVLGYAITRTFAGEVVPIATPYRPRNGWRTARLEDPSEVAALIAETTPGLLIYGHAVCDVAKCETHPDWARRINLDSVTNAVASLPRESRLVYLSSDHVFGGDGCYTESSTPTPITHYGRLRVSAERLVSARPNSLVLRYGLPIGESIDGRTGFHDWLHYRATRDLPITLIRDEYRSAVCANELAVRVMALARSDETGTRHIPATRCVSRVELAGHLMKRECTEPSFMIRTKAQQPLPHLGKVEIRSNHRDSLAAPLRSYCDDTEPAADQARGRSRDVAMPA